MSDPKTDELVEELCWTRIQVGEQWHRNRNTINRWISLLLCTLPSTHDFLSFYQHKGKISPYGVWVLGFLHKKQSKKQPFISDERLKNFISANADQWTLNHWVRTFDYQLTLDKP